MGSGWTVVWARGEGCCELAEALAPGEARHVEGDLKGACIQSRADVLVAGSITSFDLIPSVSPRAVDLGSVGSVVAAVAGGPHSEFAARVAQRIASTLGVAGSVVSVSQDDDTDHRARKMLDQVSRVAPDLERWLLRAASAGAMVEELDSETLLILGAPGGSWLQRQFFGPGKRLRSAAPNGVVVVRDVPARCFHKVETEIVAFGTELAVADARRVLQDPWAPVVEDGKLIGIVKRTSMDDAVQGATVGDLMTDPVFVYIDDPLDDVGELAEFLDKAPVPVVDRAGRLLGSIPS